MRLKKIEIQGFKSFPDKTQLIFDHDITVIVGPNGSGKSNIADAVRFVLGEQSAKNLRGSNTSDLIFSGTKRRKALNFCQVAITFDNSDGQIPLDYKEVILTRRAYRSGESEYLINKSKVRLKDVREAFMDTGLGKEGYSIIGQGKIDQILNSGGDERRAIFEEATGIVKLRYKKENAEKKLVKTEENLKDLNKDLDLEKKSLDILREKSDKAREGIRLSQALKEKEILLFKVNSEKDELRKKSLSENLSSKKFSLDEEMASLKSYKDEIGPLNERISSLEEEKRDLDQERMKLQRDISKGENDRNISQERISFSESEIKRIGEERDSLLSEREGLLKNLKEGEEKKKNLDEDLASKNEDMGLKRRELKAISQNRERLYDGLTSFKEKRDRLLEEEYILEARRQKRQGILESREENKKKWRENLERNEVQKKSNDEKIKKTESSLNKLSKEVEDLNLIIEKDNLELKSLNDRKKFIDRDIGDKKTNLRDRENRLEFLSQAYQQNEGYYKSVQDLLREAKNREDISSRMEGSLADLIRVDDKYKLAIEVALGQAQQNIVTRNEEDTKYIMDFLKEKKIGRITFLPMNKVWGKDQERSSDSKVISATDTIHTKEDYRPIINHLLNRTYIVSNMEKALEVSRKSKKKIRLITLSGEVINPSGSMVGGVLNKRRASLLNRRENLNKLREEIVSLKGQLEDLGEEADLLKDNLEEKTSSIRKNMDSYEYMEGNKRDLEKDLYSLNERKSWLINEEKDLRERIEEDQTLPDLEDSSIIREERESLDESIAKREGEISSLDEKISDLNDHIKELETHIHDLEKKLLVLNSKIESSKKSLKINEENEEKNRVNIDHYEKEKEIHSENVKKYQSEIIELERAYRDREDRINSLEKRKKDLSNELEDLRGKISQVERFINEMEKEILSLELKIERIDEKIEEERDKICQEYELSSDDLSSYLAGKALVKAPEKGEIKTLKDRLKEIGYFNYSSIEEYEKARLDMEEHLSQIEDLKKAREDILVLIEDLERSMEKTFREKFIEINGNFDRIFKRMFNGGHAELILDDKDVLKSDIEIIAQPPGKALKNMGLLSGGERSLTAVCLLLAIFEMHPAPFCILDEVDAALDESNIGRYSAYLKDFPQDVQFIIITHRKTSMEIADLMYGVTMEEEGVSRVLTLELESEVDEVVG